MEQLSRSEKKRRAKDIEALASELVKLSPSEVKKLDCDDFIRSDIKEAQCLKGGARKRQIKYITKQLRSLDVDPLLTFLTEKKGSKLKQNQAFQQLEHWRDNIITDAMYNYHSAEKKGLPFNESWDCSVLDEIAANFKNLDQRAIKIAAVKYTKSRKPTFNREIFRILKAAHEGEKYL